MVLHTLGALKMVIFIQVKYCVYGSKDRPSNSSTGRQQDLHVEFPFVLMIADDQQSNSQRLN